MQIDYQWIKTPSAVIGRLAQALGLTAFIETGTYYMGDTVAILSMASVQDLYCRERAK